LPKRSIEFHWTDVIFAPNKASQMAPSKKGTKLYMPNLIKFCMTDGNENKIWLDKTTRLKKLSNHNHH
jgi:hypothetical protein